MKVLVVPTWYPSGEDKLMGNYHKEFTYALNDNGINADMLFIDRQRSSKPFKYLFMKKKVLEKEKNYCVYKYRMLNFSFVSFDFALNRYVKRFEKALKDYIKKNGKPDVIHAHVTVPAGYACAVVSKKLDIPVVVTEHCGNLERFFKGPLEKYGKFVLKNTLFSTVSYYMQKEVLKYTDECLVIPNIVDTSVFKSSKKRKIDTTFNLVSVCALREGKKIDITFKALRKLVGEGFKNIHFTIIGDGFEEKFYKDKCEELGLNDYVTFLGRKSKDEVSEILKNQHALIISSDIESFAIPGIEALASGIPVISTRCLGPEEYINSKNGILCSVNDENEIADAIKKMYDNYSDYNPKDLRESIKRFESKNVVLEVKKIYERMIK